MCRFRKLKTENSYSDNADIDYIKDSDGYIIPDFMDINPYVQDADEDDDNY